MSRVVLAVLAAQLLATVVGGSGCDAAAPPGAAATGGHPGAGGAATGGSGTGGAPAGDAAVADDGPDPAADACNDGDLWSIISEYEMSKIRLGSCLPRDSGTATVVFDGDGAIADITGTPFRDGPTKAEWLQMLAERRWPCRAGQTIHYGCFAD